MNGHSVAGEIRIDVARETPSDSAVRWLGSDDSPGLVWRCRIGVKTFN